MKEREGIWWPLLQWRNAHTELLSSPVPRLMCKRTRFVDMHTTEIQDTFLYGLFLLSAFLVLPKINIYYPTKSYTNIK